MVSAFWHGFYFAYYIAFFFSALICEVAKDLFKARSLFNFVPKPFRWILANQMTMFALDYHFVTINALTFDNILNFFNATYWFGVILPFVALGITRGLGLAKFARNFEQK